MAAVTEKECTFPWPAIMKKGGTEYLSAGVRAHRLRLSAVFYLDAGKCITNYE